jgi:hypothetical protein
VTDTNVFRLSHPGSFADSLTEVLRNGACALLAQAVEAEVAALLSCHADKLTADGRQRLVVGWRDLVAAASVPPSQGPTYNSASYLVVGQ